MYKGLGLDPLSRDSDIGAVCLPWTRCWTGGAILAGGAAARGRVPRGARRARRWSHGYPADPVGAGATRLLVVLVAVVATPWSYARGFRPENKMRYQLWVTQ